MADPFRSELDATRARVEALAADNEDLRAELARLRAMEATVARRSAPRPDEPVAPAQNPELSALAEGTLEHLEELSDQRDAAPYLPPEAMEGGSGVIGESPDAARRRGAVPPERAATHVERANPFIGMDIDDPPRWSAVPAALPAVALAPAKALEIEVEELRRFQRRARRWIVIALGAGVSIGALLGALAR